MSDATTRAVGQRFAAASNRPAGRWIARRAATEPIVSATRGAKAPSAAARTVASRTSERKGAGSSPNATATPSGSAEAGLNATNLLR